MGRGGSGMKRRPFGRAGTSRCQLWSGSRRDGVGDTKCSRQKAEPGYRSKGPRSPSRGGRLAGKGHGGISWGTLRR